MSEYNFEISTTSGPILPLSTLYSVFTRFEEPEKATEKFGCSFYSGKHNFHYSDPEQCYTWFRCFIEEVIK